MNFTNSTRLNSKYVLLAIISILIFGCKEKENESIETSEEMAFVEPEVYEFGFKINDFIVKRDTVRRGDSFGKILEKNRIGYPQIYEIATAAKDSFDVRRLQIGKPYTILCSKDSLQTPRCFIYQPNLEEYIVVNFQDSIHAYSSRKPIKYVERTVTGVVNNSISVALDEKGISPVLTNKLATNIYAWTIDFNRLQKGDSFKVIYTDKYIDDTIYAGVHDVKAAYFNHNNEPFYAFKFQTDSVKGIYDFFDDEANNLRRAFLKSPIEFMRVSSRYNLNRRIAYYGYALRPHKGTDFAAAVGTPIMATASGVVTESRYKGGNGNYVKIRHNSTYETQYLHMQKRKVKVGEYVKQGDVIGWVGMTGNTGGPHVCYRFWKNGRQVDPFKEELPQADPISESLKSDYLAFIAPIKKQLDNLLIEENEEEIPNENMITYNQH